MWHRRYVQLLALQGLWLWLDPYVSSLLAKDFLIFFTKASFCKLKSLLLWQGMGGWNLQSRETSQLTTPPPSPPPPVHMQFGRGFKTHWGHHQQHRQHRHPLHLYTERFTLGTLHSILCNLHSPLNTLHSALCTLNFTLHTPHFTPRTPRSYTLHFTLYTWHSTL